MLGYVLRRLLLLPLTLALILLVLFAVVNAVPSMPMDAAGAGGDPDDPRRAYQVFNSKRDFSGKNVSKEFMIENASKSRVVLALISVNYFDSTWCCVEVTGASKAGTPVVPVYAGQTITGNACKKFIALKSVRREGCVACRLQLPRTVLWCATLCRPMPSPG